MEWAKVMQVVMVSCIASRRLLARGLRGDRGFERLQHLWWRGMLL